MPPPEPHLDLPVWRRAVVKVGSALVAPEGQGGSDRYLGAIARFIERSRKAGREVVLVSSGAVAAGLAIQPGRPRTIPEKQALAALGQPLLMAHWSRLLDAPCAQVLLTHDDLSHRTRYVNARNTLHELLARSVLPIVNENDTVAVDELRVGDNDNLAAHVATLVDADLLVIGSDIDGLYEADPRRQPDARFIGVVDRVTPEIHAMAGGAHASVATGGMRTKLQAAEKATTRGIPTVLVNGTDADALDALATGILRGTLFRAQNPPLPARKHWLLHATPTVGRIQVDAGAADAVCHRGASLLPSGIVGAEGDFHRGDAVEITLGDDVLARGIVRFDVREVQRIAGCQNHQVQAALGYAHPSTVVVHRDDLVLMG